MKCGIFGDSYAFRSNDYAWCALLEKDYEVENFSASGTSIWNAYKKFLENYKNFEYIIFTYSVQNRFYHLPEHLEKFMYIKNVYHDGIQYIDKNDVELFKSILEAEQHTHDPILDHFIYQQVFNEVNRICIENKIKLINLMPFETANEFFPTINLEKRNGTCILGLHWVSMNEISRINKLDQGDDRPCHISNKNNEILYNLIREQFNNLDYPIINVKEKPIFVL